MSRILRGNQADASTIHSLKADDGIHEVSAGDISLPDEAAAFTSAATIEQWLEILQIQLNSLSNTTAPNPSLLRLGVKQ